jgi:hypothetical protein
MRHTTTLTMVATCLYYLLSGERVKFQTFRRWKRDVLPIPHLERAYRISKGERTPEFRDVPPANGNMSWSSGAAKQPGQWGHFLPIGNLLNILANGSIPWQRRHCAR